MSEWQSTSTSCRHHLAVHCCHGTRFLLLFSLALTSTCEPIYTYLYNPLSLSVSLPLSLSPSLAPSLSPSLAPSLAPSVARRRNGVACEIVCHVCDQRLANSPVCFLRCADVLKCLRLTVATRSLLLHLLSLARYERLAQLGDYYGIESTLLGPDEIADIHPLISSEGTVGAMYSPSDGTLCGSDAP